MEERLIYIRDNLIKTLETEFEVKITYSSISPSFFNRIKIRDLNIYNAETEEKIAQFSLLYFDYRLYSLLKKDFSSIFSYAGVYDGIIDFNYEKNENILKKIKILSSGKEKAEAIVSVDSSQDNILQLVKENLKKFTNIQPINIELKNIAINYGDNRLKVNFYTSNGTLVLNSTKIDFNLNSSFRYSSLILSGIPAISTSININGSFYPNTSSASSIVNFSNIKVGNVHVNKFSIFASYLDKIASITTLQDIQPIDLKGSWNTSENSGNINLECKNFHPFLIFSGQNKNDFFQLLKDTSFTGNFNLSFSKDKRLLWNTGFGVDIPKFKLSGTEISNSFLNFQAEGDENLINIKKLNIRGEDIGLSLSGTYGIKEILPNFDLNVSKFKLPSGENFTVKLNVSSFKDQILANIRQLKLGSASFEDIQGIIEKKEKKTDVYLSVKDQSGRFNIDGTWTHPKDKVTKENPGYLELHGAADAISLSNLYSAVESIVSIKIPANNFIKNFLSPVRMTNEFYISSDFKQVSYNIIQMVLASSEKNGFYSLFSLKGNESSFNVNDIDILFSDIHLKGSLNSCFENEGLVFDSFFTLNNITYNIAGLLADEMLSIYGDYGLNINIVKNNKDKLRGTIQVKELPIPFINSLFSADTVFEYEDKTDWEFTCSYAKLEYIETDITRTDDSLEFYVEGYAKPDEVFFHNVKAGIKNKQMEGTAAFNLVPILDKDVNQYAVNISLSDKSKTEFFLLNSLFSISDKIYFDGTCDIKNISLNRFLKKQKQENKLNAEFVFLGNKDAVSIKSDIKEINFNLKGKNLEGRALSFIDNNQISISDSELRWGLHKIDDIKALISPSEQQASLEFKYRTDTDKKENKASVLVNFTSTADLKDASEQSILKKTLNLTSHFSINIKISDWAFAGQNGEQDITASLIREPNIIALYAGENDNIYGFKTDDGVVSLHIDESLPIHFNLDGTVTKESIDLSITNIGADLAKVVDAIPNNDIIKFSSGALKGNVMIKGSPKDPVFYGELNGEGLYCTSPNYSPDTYGPVNIPITLDGTLLHVPYTVLTGKVGSLWAQADSEFIGWLPYYTTINCGILEKTQAWIKTKNIIFQADGRAEGKVRIDISPDAVALDGAAHFDKGYFSVFFGDTKRQKDSSSGNSTSFSMNLDLSLGKKSEFRFPSTDLPVLRAIAYTEDTPFNLNVDTLTDKFEMSGYAKIRTGDIFYIKRNFYIKEGELKILNTPLNIEPIISVRAEIRDKTADGQPITISLTAKDQYLDLERFKPVISTSPPTAMSDSETMALMGQVALSDLGKGNVLKEALLNTSDILAQMGFLKKIEQEARSLLHVDVFSLRSLLIQNVILENLFKSANDKPLTIGNYFDNTSVYIGKYFGSAIYADAMLHLSYYDPLSIKKDIVKKSVYGNLLFQPEIGLEMSTPFFLLRWHMTPSSPDTLFVQDAGLTISWKYSY